MKKSAWVFILLCVLVFGFVSVSLAATFMVNSTGTASDANDGDGICADSTGACTIIAAIEEANALSGADEITFSVDGTFVLTDSFLNISESLTLTGNGADTTILSGGQAIMTESNSTVAISELGIQSFTGVVTSPYGPIHNEAGSTLTFTNCTLSNNSFDGGAGIVNNYGTLRIMRSTLANNSTSYTGIGTLYNTGTATIESSTFSGNTVSSGDSNNGGAIYNTGTLNLNNSTISGNSAQNNGGGIYNASTGTLYLFSSTIAYNTADSAVANAGSGGGIYNNGGTVLARNNIIAENTDNSSTAPDCAGTLAWGSYNLIGDTTGCTVSNLTHTLTGASGLNSTLIDNGGSTNTHALTSTSAAVDSAGVCSDSDSNPLTTDQRGTGYTREYNSSCDRGAFEYIGAETTCTDDVDEDNDDATDCDDSDCSATSDCFNCGDGIIQDSEECDDGSAVSGDGCSETCLAETRYYLDTDGDNYGDATNSTVSLVQPTGYVTDATDCNDTDGTVYPGATEVCDDMDNDCDGTSDTLIGTFYYDGDGDGEGSESLSSSGDCEGNAPSNHVSNASDCDDSNSAINTSATEICGDAIDQNCDDLDLACSSESSADDDADGTADTGDNCPLLANADQLDTDSDGMGNVCDTSEDTDDDGDGTLDTIDDSDGDGIVDAEDPEPTVPGSDAIPSTEDDDTLLDAVEVADGGEVSDDAVDALDDGVVDGETVVGDAGTGDPAGSDTGETVTPPSDDSANDDNNADSDGGSGGGCSLNAKHAGSEKNLSFLIFLLPIWFFRGRLEYRSVISRRSDMSKFFIQALTSFLIAHLVFLPTLAQAQMKGTALQPPQSPPESVRSLKPGQFITFKDKDDDLVHNFLYFSFDDSESLLEQISDKVVDKNAQNCATLLLKDSLYQGMAAKSLNGPAVMHTDMLKPMEKDCGNVLVKLTPMGFELTPQKMTELRKNDPALAQMIDRSLGIKEAQAGVGLVMGVAAGLGVGLGLVYNLR